MSTVKTAKGSEVSLDTNGVVYNKYTSEERESITSLFSILMDPRINLSEIATRHYAKFHPGRKRGTSRSDLYNKFTYRKAFQPGELDNIKSLLAELGFDLIKAKMIQKLPSVSVLHVGEQYLKDLSPSEYEEAIKMVRDMRVREGQQYILPYYVRTPKPFILNLAWYEYHVRSEKIVEVEEGLERLKTAMDLLYITWDEAAEAGYRLNEKTREDMLKRFEANVGTMNGPRQTQIRELLEPENWFDDINLIQEPEEEIEENNV